ncbi:MAG TPA: M20 family metallopeptidase [Anaeromyxobacteraceae bacterium]|nr:M20 family metallopeptidase [Anaeromyxobacteraceae bacterium]
MADLDAALAWLAGQRPAMVALLSRLVRQNSFTRNREGVNAVASALEAELRRLGLECQRLTGGAFGDHLFFEGRAAGAPAFLLGHLDTVFPPGEFEGFESDGARARGPGVLDMKGGLVVGLFALEALSRAGLLERVPLRGLFVADEEMGSPSSQPLTRERAQGSACALGLESGRPGDLIVTRRKGIASLDVSARGVSAHAGSDHQKGRNAVWALARFVDRAQALTDDQRGITVSVGRIEGGTTRNTVPDRARCEVDLRFLAERDGAEAVGQLRRAAAEAALAGTSLEVAVTNTRPPLERTDASAALAAEYGAIQRQCGLGSGEAPLSGGGSDASVAGSAGVPSIDGLGPRGAAFHTRDEHIELDSLVPKAAALARFLGRRAG